MIGSRSLLLAAALACACVSLVDPGAAAAQSFANDSAWLASKGFWQRMPDALLHGDREAVRGWNVRRLTDIADVLPRIEVRTVANERVLLLHATPEWRDDRSDEGCPITVYINGGRLHPTDGQTPSLRAIERVLSARDLAGVELYEGVLAPVGEGDLCATLLLWSRRVRGRLNEEFAGRLRGRATWLPDSVPAGGIAMTLNPGARRQDTDSGGWFDFGALPPGRYEITAEAPDGATWTGQLMVRAFAIAQIAIEVIRREEEEEGAW